MHSRSAACGASASSPSVRAPSSTSNNASSSGASPSKIISAAHHARQHARPAATRRRSAVSPMHQLWTRRSSAPPSARIACLRPETLAGAAEIRDDGDVTSSATTVRIESTTSRSAASPSPSRWASTPGHGAPRISSTATESASAVSAGLHTRAATARSAGTSCASTPSQSASGERRSALCSIWLARRSDDGNGEPGAAAARSSWIRAMRSGMHAGCF